MDIQQFFDRIRSKYLTGDATEHSYRSALEALFESIGPGISAINEPKRVACGAPDFVIRVGGIDIGHCEAKDIDISLQSLNDTNKEQKKRYLRALPNLIYTNGLDFEFYRSGQLVRRISIGALVGAKVLADPAEYSALEAQLQSFAAERPQTIGTAKKLAEMMAGKAALIKDIMGRALDADIAADNDTDLRGQYEAFRAHLIHEITVAEFADIYAETVAYGLFAARLHDTTTDTFTRSEALELLPKSNPFLRSLFGYIAGVDLDDRIRWVIDELCDVFRAANLHEILKDFGKFTAQNDPFIHFYETFLTAYNPAKRRARGVWYTPEPVVNFIVRAVDEVLKSEFKLSDGLADTGKITIDWETGQTNKEGRREKIQKQVHRVQVLDPATGTGTFLTEVVKQVSAHVKSQASGMWSNYVEQDLIPRLHGFELLMASYAMCHMKLDMVLTELGYHPTAAPPRLGIYLTNSLEEGEAVNQNLFAQWLANEAKSASEIKRHMPIMCVIGNPPYSAISRNTGGWINDLIEDYKYVEGVHFAERKHWLHDDYVKFVRFAEYMIDKNGEGILGFITNHGYLDNPTFRGMRHRLLETFDKLYVLDLHGNANKREVSPDGSADRNVFDIQQGVAVLIAIKKTASPTARDRGKKSNIELGQLLHSELWGPREGKYERLWNLRCSDTEWTEIKPEAPLFMFKPRDYGLADQYGKGFSLSEFLPVFVSGVITARDNFVVDADVPALTKRVQEFGSKEITDEDFQARYNLSENYQWKCSAQRKLFPGFDARNLKPILYRQFDQRTIYYQDNLVFRTRRSVMRHMYEGPNLALLSPRITGDEYAPWVSEHMVANKAASRYDQTYLFPLYLYPNEGELETEPRLNYDAKLYAALREKAGLTKDVLRVIHDEKDGRKSDELRVFDYIYGALHSPDYRSTYSQFLKVDFPRVPWPANPKIFGDLSILGGQLRMLHLMDHSAIGHTPYPFQGQGAGEVDKVEFKDESRVVINSSQWFENVPRTAWDFDMGGYLPAQKWLTDRKGSKLTFDDARQYQRIIKILVETDRIMREIVLPLNP